MAWISQAAHFLNPRTYWWSLSLLIAVLCIVCGGWYMLPGHRTNLCLPDSPKFCQLWLCASECLPVEKDEKKCIYTGIGVLNSVALEWYFLMSWLVMDNLMVHWFWNINFHNCIMKFASFVVLNQSFNVYYAVFHFSCLAFCFWQAEMLIAPCTSVCPLFSCVHHVIILHMHALNLEAVLRIITCPFLICIYSLHTVLITVNLYPSVPWNISYIMNDMFH